MASLWTRIIKIRKIQIEYCKCNTNVLQYCWAQEVHMSDKKFILKAKRYIEESQVLSVRMPKDMLRDVDAVAEHTGRTRNEIILKSIEFALRNLEIPEDE